MKFTTNDQLVDITVSAPTWPDDADDCLKNGQVVNISCVVIATVTPQFDEWAKMNGVPYTIEYENNTTGPLIDLSGASEEAILWFKMRWM